MFGKLAEAKEKAAEIKERLEQVSVMGQSESGAVRAIVSGGRKVLDLQINDASLSPENLKQEIIQAVNHGLEQADKVSEAEMAAVAKELMPGGLGALAGMFKK